jgi:ketopantoate hydroxymethyltransferase
MQKITAPGIRGRKGGEKITMLTAYDFPSADNGWQRA